MEGKNFLKLCKDTKMMSKSLTSTDIDLIFTKVCVFVGVCVVDVPRLLTMS